MQISASDCSTLFDLAREIDNQLRHDAMEHERGVSKIYRDLIGPVEELFLSAREGEDVKEALRIIKLQSAKLSHSTERKHMAAKISLCESIVNDTFTAPDLSPNPRNSPLAMAARLMIESAGKRR